MAQHYASSLHNPADEKQPHIQILLHYVALQEQARYKEQVKKKNNGNCN